MATPIIIINVCLPILGRLSLYNSFLRSKTSHEIHDTVAFVFPEKAMNNTNAKR